MERLLPPLEAQRRFQRSYPWWCRTVFAALSGGTGLGLRAAFVRSGGAARRCASCSANGIEVVIPPDQNCCGAMPITKGELEQDPGSWPKIDSTVSRPWSRGQSRGTEPLMPCWSRPSGAATPSKYDELLGPPPRQITPPGRPAGSLHRSGGRCGRNSSIGSELSEHVRRQLQPAPAQRRHSGDGERPLRLAYHDACHMIPARACATNPRRSVCVRSPMCSFSKRWSWGGAAAKCRHLQPGATQRSRRAGADQSTADLSQHRRPNWRERQHSAAASRSPHMGWAAQPADRGAPSVQPAGAQRRRETSRRARLRAAAPVPCRIFSA